MHLPPAIADRVVEAAAHEIAAHLAADMQSLRLVTYKDAAELLGVSQRTAKRLIAEYVELGEATRRVKLSTLRAVIEARTFRHGCGGKNAGGGTRRAESVSTGGLADEAAASGTLCLGMGSHDKASGGLGAAAGQCAR